MYNTLEFFKMLRLLQADLTYSRIKDPEEKMRYFVRKHHSSIMKYIKNSMKVLARSIDKTQRLEIDVLVPGWQLIFIEHAQALYMDCSENILDTNSNKILEFLDKILAKVSFSFGDNDSLFVLALYFGLRSLIHTIHGHEKKFQSDFKHVVYLINEMTGDYLGEQLTNNHPMIRMFIQLSFILGMMSFPAKSDDISDGENLCTQVLRVFVDNIKHSVHNYAEQLCQNGPESVRNPVLDKIVAELSNERELEPYLIDHIRSHDWKIFVALFEHADSEFDYETLLSSMLEFSKTVHNNLRFYSNLSQAVFQLNKKVVLEETETGGRCYVADSHIQIEEPVLIEKPLSCVLFQEYYHVMCSTCQKQVVTPFPCSGCTELVFCNLECSKIAQTDYHWLECGCYAKIIGNDQFTVPHAVRLYSMIGIEYLLKQIQRTENEKLGLAKPEPVKSNAKIVQNYIEQFAGKKKAEFNTNSSNSGDRTAEKNILNEAINSLLVHRWSRQSDREIIHSIWSLNVVALFILRDRLPMEFIDKHNLGKFASLLESITCRLLSICTNGFGWLDLLECYDLDPNTSPPVSDEYLRMGSSICFVGSFFNHSCKPNVTWTISKDVGLQMYAVRPIEPKELLCISYGPRYPTSFNERQKSLKDNYCFLCQCELCLSDASELLTTLSCLNPNNSCNGPLVLNRHHSCLKCGYKSSYAEYSLYLNRLNAFRVRFKDLYKKLEFKHGKSTGNIVNKVAFYTSGALKRKTMKLLLSLKGIVNSHSGVSSTVERLRKVYDTIHQLMYTGSFNLLEYSVQMLKAYKWENYDDCEKIFQIIKIVIECLENANSDAILSSANGDDIVKNIEFCSEYFVEYFNHTYPDKNFDNLALNAIETLKRIDLTLVNILKPIALNVASSDTSASGGDLALEYSKDKTTYEYVNMFMNAQKRILMYDNAEE